MEAAVLAALQHFNRSVENKTIVGPDMTLETFPTLKPLMIPRIIQMVDPLEIPLTTSKPIVLSIDPLLNATDDEIILTYQNKYTANRFNDIKYLVKSAAHGVQFNRIGTLYAFSDEFIHFIKMEFPFKNYRLPAVYNMDTCYNFVERLPPLNGTIDLRNILNRTCFSFEESIQEFIDSANSITNNALEEFKTRQLTRTKRQFDPFTLGAVAVAGAVGWGIWITSEVVNSKHDRRLLYQKISELEREVDKIERNFITVGESLLGFSEEISSTIEQYDQKIELLRNFSIQRTVEMDQAITNISEFLDAKSFVVAIMSTFGDYRLSEINGLQNQMMILLDGIQTYENIFATLRTGRLSHALINWEKLKRILYKIDDALQRKFVFAISEQEHHLYYSLPLISFDIKRSTQDIYISLRIPLVRRGRPRRYTIIKPQFLPFSCIDTNCFKQGDGDRITSFDPSNKLWLTNEETGELMNEIDPDAINCEYVNHKQICFTFQTNQMTEPSECNKGIYSWNQEHMIKHCKFIPRHVNEYQPIDLGGDRYVIHKNVKPHYDLHCDEKLSVRKEVQNWTELIELERGCNIGLPDFGRILYGPFSIPLRSEEILEPSTFHSVLLLLLQNASIHNNMVFTELKLPKLENPYVTPFRPEDHAITVDWDTNTLTKFSNYLYKWNSNISTAVRNVEMLIGKRSDSYFLKGLIGTIGGATELLLTMIIVFRSALL